MTQSAGGRKAWALAAPQARLLAEGGARMLRPRIRIFREGREGSIAESREAYVKDGSGDITLVGDVVIRSPQEKAVLRTDRLAYGAREGRFRTDSLVALERPGVHLRGRGLDADGALAEIRIHQMESDLR